MGGRISDLNKEGSELELDSTDSRMDVDVQVEGVSYNSDTNSAQQEEIKKPASALGASAEASAQRRLAKELARREKQSLKKRKESKKTGYEGSKGCCEGGKISR